MKRRVAGALAYSCLYAGLFCLTASAQKPQLIVQTGQPVVVGIAFSPDGKTVASAGESLKLWDVGSGREIYTFTEHVADVECLAFSPDGKTLATGTTGEGVILWDVATRRKSASLSTKEWVLSVAFSLDGKTLASQGGTVLELWDVRTGTRTGTLPTRVGHHTSLAFSSDGRTLSSAADLGIKLWDLTTSSEIRTLTGHTGGVTSVAFSPDGKTLASGSEDKTIRLWDKNSGNEIRTLTGPNTEVFAVAFSPDGKTLASGMEDKTIRLWDTMTGKEIRHLSGHVRAVNSVAFSSDGRTLASGSPDCTVRLWDVTSGKMLRAMGGPSENITAVRFSPNGKLLAWGTDNKTIKLWDVAAGKEIQTLTGHDDWILSLAFSPDSATLASGSADKTVVLWDVDAGQVIRRLTDQTDKVNSVAFSPDGRFLASGSFDSMVKLWDASTGKAIRTLAGQGTGINPVAFSPDGKTLASVTSAGLLNRAIKLWDVASGKELRTLLPGHVGFVTSVAFSPDGKMLASRGFDEGTIKLWNSTTGELIGTVPSTSQWLQQVAFSPDGRLLAGGGYGGTIKLWDLRTGQENQTTTSVVGSLDTISFAPDGNTLASGGTGPELHLWDVRHQRELGGLFAFPDGTWAVVDPDGRYDASNAGRIDWLHWVVGNEPIDLDQLKERYYEPGLLSKLLGFNKEPLLDVGTFTSVALYPEVSLTAPQGNNCEIGIQLTNRGGGIGRVMVAVNGKEVTADARGKAPNPQAQQLDLPVNVSKSPFLKAGQENTIQVRVFNADGYLSSRNIQSVCKAPGEAPLVRPSFWAIVAGISEYAGENIRLRYAGKDAADMAQALRIGAERLFGADRTHIVLLTTAPAPGAVAPTRENLRKAFEGARQAKPTDILVVYLAGHGVAYGGQEGDYYYLTREARTGDLTDPAVRAQTAVSSRELTEWIKQIPALKQTLVLDTCAAAKLVQKLSERRDVPSSQIRSLERMKDRMGLHILAGSAADAVSYEASQYGQGLLTYSLLLGMRGGALREDRFVDVSKWFDFATEEVPQLAKDIGGIQKPERYTPCRIAEQAELACGSSATWDIGQLLGEDKARIPLATPRPVFLQSTFQDEVQLRDQLKLTGLVNEALREVSSRGQDASLVYVDAAEFPDAYLLAGRYRVEGSRVTAKVSVFKGEKQVGNFTFVDEAGNLDKMTAEIVGKAQRLTTGPQ